MVATHASRESSTRAAVLDVLDLATRGRAEQDMALSWVERIAIRRLSHLIPLLLTDQQLGQVETMLARGAADDDVLRWVTQQIPLFGELRRAVILDVANEAAGHQH